MPRPRRPLLRFPEPCRCGGRRTRAPVGRRAHRRLSTICLTLPAPSAVSQIADAADDAVAHDDDEDEQAAHDQLPANAGTPLRKNSAPLTRNIPMKGPMIVEPATDDHHRLDGTPGQYRH